MPDDDALELTLEQAELLRRALGADADPAALTSDLKTTPAEVARAAVRYVRSSPQYQGDIDKILELFKIDPELYRMAAEEDAKPNPGGEAVAVAKPASIAEAVEELEVEDARLSSELKKILESLAKELPLASPEELREAEADPRSSHSITKALLALRAGDEKVVLDLEFLLNSLLKELLMYVRRKRPVMYRRRIDSEALVNEAFSDLLLGVRADRFPDLRSRENVRKILFTMVGRALATEIRDHSRERRNLAREIQDEIPIESHCEQTAGDLFSPFSEKHAASLTISAHEFWEVVTKTLRPVHERAIEILELLVHGYTNVEIVAKLPGLKPRNLQRIIQNMREAWFGGG